VQKLFPAKRQDTDKDRTQSRLMILAALMLISYALILSLAPSVRNHAGSETYQFNHWLGVIVWLAAFSLLNWQTREKLPDRDPYLLPTSAALTGIGLMSIWRLYPNLGLRQTIWTAAASLLVFIGLQFPVFLDHLRRYKYIWLVLGLVLTGLTIVLGENPSGGGPALWLHVFGIYVQPSEPLKLLVIGYLAGFFADRLVFQRKAILAALPSIIVAGMALVLLFFQRDLGTASIFLLVFIAMLFSARNNKWLLWAAPAFILAAAVIGYISIDVVKLRIDSWLNPFADPSSASYQVIQSMIAIAEGGILGAGPSLGSPNLIPVSVSDFIFSAITEEMGLLTAAAIILLLIILLNRGIKLALTTQNSFHKYLSLGLVYYFSIQSIMIIGGNIGLLPLTGVPLPFISYGGSSLMVSFGALLVLLIVSHETYSPPEKAPVKQPRIAWIGTILMAVLIIEILATSLLSFWFKSPLIERAENPRWIIDDRYVLRGSILDRDGNTLVYSSGEIGSYQRVSDYPALSTVIGYTNGIYGQTGIESSMFSYLRGYEGYSLGVQVWNELVYNQPLDGLDIRLTIDLDLQEAADSLLEDSIGSAILMSAESGEILVMASHPYVDPASLEEEWEHLITDETAPLLNRATQGMYPAGGSLFPFILTTQLNLVQQNPEPAESLPALLDDLACALVIEDDMGWDSLVRNGCTSVQEKFNEITGSADLLELYGDLGFFTEPSLNLTVADAETASIIYSTGAGGELPVNISPLQMSLAASALTNEGILPTPRIVNSYQDPDGEWVALPKASASVQALSSEDAAEITALLQVPDFPYWSITATAITEEGETITWFLAGTTADWQGQPLSLVIVLENSNPETAAWIGSTLMEQATRYIN